VKKLLQMLHLGFITLFVFILVACGGGSNTTGTAATTNIVFLPKQINNPYFDSAATGGQQAAKALNGSFKQVGPSTANAADQIPFITTLTEQHVSAIVLSADDPNALAPSLKTAMQQGVKVVTYDSDVATDARQVFVNQASSEEIGRSEIDLLGQQINDTGQIAILSAASTATNQNTWIDYMKDELKKPQYKNMQLVKIIYGNDDDQTSFNDTLSLVQAYPNLKGIISPTTVGIAAAARALESINKNKQIALTGLGTPNQMRKYVKDGTVQAFELWNPNDLGYLAYYTAALLAQGKIRGKQGETFTAGRLGKETIGANGVIVLGPPTVFNSSNIDKFNF
jgi:rhamnose transport system substrate-binding protein